MPLEPACGTLIPPPPAGGPSRDRLREAVVVHPPVSRPVVQDGDPAGGLEGQPEDVPMMVRNVPRRENTPPSSQTIVTVRLSRGRCPCSTRPASGASAPWPLAR